MSGLWVSLETWPSAEVSKQGTLVWLFSGWDFRSSARMQETGDGLSRSVVGQVTGKGGRALFGLDGLGAVPARRSAACEVRRQIAGW